MVSAHFPPDTNAGTHRVRLLAPHLAQYGWTPTVVTVDPAFYEGKMDPDLAALVPSSLDVVRCRAISSALTRKLGFGDLGLRSLLGLYRGCSELLSKRAFAALFITIYPSYVALIGPLLKKRFGVPFVLDYQDPWIGAWGDTVGAGPGGRADLKSRLSRQVSGILEPFVLRSVDTVTAVSRGTYDQLLARYDFMQGVPCFEMPIGGEPADFQHLADHPRPNRFFDSNDGNFHLCYVGTLLPNGFETLRAVLEAARLMKQRSPESYQRLRIHFFGTSNQRDSAAPARVMPVAESLGLECVSEMPARIDYLDALTVQLHADAILMMGSSERHYTASKLYSGLLAKRPLLAVYHEASSVTHILRKNTRAPTIRVVTYDDTARAGSRSEVICGELREMVGGTAYDPAHVNLTALHDFSAGRLAATLAHALNSAAARKPP